MNDLQRSNIKDGMNMIRNKIQMSLGGLFDKSIIKKELAEKEKEQYFKSRYLAKQKLKKSGLRNIEMFAQEK